ncbi:MAG: tryptophan-rich sensory protein, partial [Alphaproteobacteria bacterium]|nr:tryptophan-rich sensory protein [Alphaproteobacteria bacterium]
ALAATPGLVFRPGSWYQQLMKPPWRPPDWLFGPVWLVLYIMIAVSGWLVWRELGAIAVSLPLTIYAVQLALNGLWSAIFFGLRRPDWAFIEIAALLLSILATIVLFYRVNALAAYLLIPYAGWVAFAVVLNLRVSQLNPVTQPRT